MTKKIINQNPIAPHSSSSPGVLPRPIWSNYLSLRALEGEAANPGRDSLGLVAVQVDKVLSAAVELNGPSPGVGVDKLALGAVGELGQLRRSSDEAVVGNRCAGEKLGDGTGNVVGDNGGGSVGTALVVGDADGDGVVSRSGGDARGESQDGGSEDGGELHFEDWWMVVW